MRSTGLKSVITLLSFTILSFTAQNVWASETNDESSPLLTIGCLTDLHCEYGLLTCKDANDVRLRKTTVNALKEIKENENLDILLLGGDYTSLVTAPYANWQKARELLVNATRDIFKDKSYTPVIYATGNHEYEAPNVRGIPKEWNSGDYYTFPMRDDIGVLTGDECFYDNADNGAKGKMSLLAAYHYQIKGIDFIVLNTAKYLFASSSNYAYSMESVIWCGNKIESLYRENPKRTIFFIAHIPFGDSNSISYADKGLSRNQESTAELKNILSRYPDIIMLYGHDHGGDNAYIREKTSQRVTRYDTNGNVISSFDADHVDGTTKGQVQPVPVKEDATFSLKNLGNGQYLGRDGKTYPFGDDCDLNLVSSPQPVRIVARKSRNTSFGIFLTKDGNTRNLSCGTNGNMSVKDRTTATSEEENGYFFHVDRIEGSKVTVTKTAIPTVGEQYIIVYGHHEKNSPDFEYHYYTLGNSLVGGSYKRLRSAEIYQSDLSAGYPTITITLGAISNYIYTLEEFTNTPSFFSVFMGSMRYHGNSIDASYDETKEIHDPRIAQALMIYVYADRIEFRMKNYGETGTIQSDTKGKGPVTIRKDLTPYTVFREVSIITNVPEYKYTPPGNSTGIYDLSGKLIPDGGTLLERNQLPCGIYIVNGQQILAR